MVNDLSEDIKKELRMLGEDIFILFHAIHESFGMLLVTDNNFNIKYANKKFLSFVSKNFDEIKGQDIRSLKCYENFKENYLSISELINKGEQCQLELQGNTESGMAYWHFMRVDPIFDDNGKIFSILFNIEDIRAKKQHKNTIEYMAYHDLLTGLPKISVIENQFICMSKNRNILALFFIDLDRFKNINDSLGHKIGDELLKDFSRKIEDIIGSQNIMCRNGGDEFIILITDTSSEDDVKNLAKRVLEATEKIFYVENINVVMTLSMGISLYPKDGDNFHTLLKRADIAMYDAKRGGGNGFRFYNCI